MDYLSFFQKMNQGLLLDKVAVVSGEGQYQTKPILETLASEKAKVIYLQESNKNETIACPCETADFTDEKSVDKVFKKIIKDYAKIDILITNFFSSQSQEFEETTLQDMQTMFDVCTCKVFTLCKKAAEIMKKKQGGKIINIIPACSKRAYLGSGISESAASAAVIGITRVLAEQLAPFNVTVNCIVPGMIKGEGVTSGKDLRDLEKRLPFKWMPIKRMGNAQDIAWATTFLSSYFADYITGYSMDVNGGFNMD